MLTIKFKKKIKKIQNFHKTFERQMVCLSFLHKLLILNPSYYIIIVKAQNEIYDR